MTKIIAITNQKGGVGKTTTAVNLSAAIAISGKSVLLIDFDPQGNASTSLDISVAKRKNSIYDVMISNIDINKAILTTAVPNLHIIPSVMDLAGIDNIIVNKKKKELILKTEITKIQDKYDYIFIDCGPSLSLLSINALIASNSVLIPVQCEFLAMEGIAYLISTLRLIKTTVNKELFIEGIVLTMLDKRNKLCNAVSEEVRKEFIDLVYNVIIPRNIKLTEAPSHKKPAIIYDVKSLGSVSYIMLAKEFMLKNSDYMDDNRKKHHTDRIMKMYDVQLLT